MIFDTIVIGAGAMGSATAYWLSKYQSNVMLLDQFDLLHHQGSSHGLSRVIRRTYKEDHFAHMMTEAYQLWDDIQKETNTSVYRQTGGLNFGPEDNSDLQMTMQVCEEKGVQYELLRAQELRNRFPAFRSDDDYMGIYQSDTGILNASKSVDMLQTQASKQGAVLKGNEKILSLSQSGGKVHVVTNKGDYLANKIVITAGAWLNTLLSHFDLSVDMEIWKLTFAYWKTLKPEFFTSDRFPVFIHWDNEINYGFPINERQDYVKIAPHITEQIPKQDVYDGQNQINTELLEEMSGFIRERFNHLSDEPSYAETCLYSMTEKEDFIMDYLPNNENIVVGGGFSGHGFKFTPLIGKILSDMVLNNEISYDLKHFKLGNF